MSLDAVQRVVFFAVTNEDFRNSLKADPDGFLGERDLTPEEITSLKAMDWSSVEATGRDLEQRVSRMGLAIAACH